MCVTEYDNLAALLGAFRLTLFVCNVVINWPFLQCPHNTYVLHVEHAYVRTYVCVYNVRMYVCVYNVRMYVCVYNVRTYVCVYNVCTFVLYTILQVSRLPCVGCYASKDKTTHSRHVCATPCFITSHLSPYTRQVILRIYI